MREALRSKQAQFSGQYGIDWWAVTGEGKMLKENELEQASLICLAFNPRNRFIIPRASQPIYLPPRLRMNEVLRPIPEGETVPFYITETTSKISMGEDVYGVILMGVEDGTNQRHIQSPLIDSGYGVKEGGLSVRLEIADPAMLSEKNHTYISILCHELLRDEPRDNILFPCYVRA